MDRGQASDSPLRLSMNDDWAGRRANVHWPTGLLPADADLFAHNEMYIDASPPLIWRSIIEAQKWPVWYPNAHDVRIVNDRFGVLMRGSEFSWRTFGLHVDSKVIKFVPFCRLDWFSKSPGIEVYRTWLLIPASDGCQVVTEESAKGPVAVAVQQLDPDVLHKGSDLWLRTLRLLSERPPPNLHLP